MTTKRMTSIAVAALILLVAAGITGYLLYAIPQSDADRLGRQVSTLKTERTKLASELAAANRRASAAERRAASAFARGHASGLADAAASTQSRYDAGYAAGNAAAFGPFGNDWTDGGFYVIRVEAAAQGQSHRISTRAALRECLAVYAQNGSVFVQGPAC